MVQEQNPKADLNIGCSNITQLQVSSPGSQPALRQRRPYYTPHAELEAEHSAAGEDYQQQLNKRQFNSIVSSSQQQTGAGAVPTPTLLHGYSVLDSLNKSFLPGLGLGILVTSVVVLIWGATRIRQSIGVNGGSGDASLSSISSGMQHHHHHHHNNNNNNGSNSRPGTPTATTCYAASDHIARLTDAENGARYVKLQATTSL